ncbi:MAG: Crp/Fnr family transcriptional regulator [Anaerolineae bacterium]|jgi:CRP-like cAMP-binding protein
MNDAHPAISIISAIPYFADLDRDTLQAIAQQSVRQHHATRQVIFVEGEPCMGLYFIQTGWLKVVKVSAQGREQILRFVGPGESLNELGVLSGSPNPATAIALEPVDLWVVPRAALFRLIDEHPGLARAMIVALAHRTQYLLGLVEDLSLHTVEARLARFLLQESVDGVLPRRRWATQTEIAARLGTVLDVLSRALRGLADENLIRIERTRIEILDREGLETKAAHE